MTFSITDLEARVAKDLEILNYPARPWVLKPKGITDDDSFVDVLVIGAGQCGMSICFELQRNVVQRVLAVDRNPAGFEGPWAKYARMRTLRTPNYIIGVEGNIPSLTFRSWYEAQHGAQAWEKLDKIPTPMWMEYLVWFRTVLNLPVRNDTNVDKLEWCEEKNSFKVTMSNVQTGESDVMYARKVVSATGMEGGGDWNVPSFISDALPASKFNHTADAIDFNALKGKKVAVLGAGASAFDNAATALELGVGSVDLYFRRKQLPRINPIRWMEFTGFLKHYADLTDAMKWEIMWTFMCHCQPPTNATYDRAAKFDTFATHADSAWTKVEVEGEQVRVHTKHGSALFDHLIIGTGMVVDTKRRPEYALFEEHIQRWGNCFTPPEGREHAALIEYPYLTRDFQYTETTPGAAPYLKHLYDFNFGCTLSMGLSGAALSGLKFSLKAITNGITKSLFVDDADRFLASLHSYDVIEFSRGMEEDAEKKAE